MKKFLKILLVLAVLALLADDISTRVELNELKKTYIHLLTVQKGEKYQP